jgi:mannose-6-phosphate isomerase-like protein (cupin superfamily)
MTKRPPIQREKFFVKRIEEGFPLNADTTAGQMEQMRQRQPELYKHNVEMFGRPDGRYYALLGPKDTAPPDQPLDGFAVAYLQVGSGADFPSHVHANRCAFFYIIEGQGKVVLDGETFPIEKGDIIFVKPGTAHMFLSEPGPLHYIVVVRPDLFTADPDGTFDVVFPK